jgi:hypothetical protein
MPNQEIIERFRNHGVDIQADQSSTHLIRELRDTDPETLWLMVEDFSDNKPIGMNSPNEKMHRLTLSYALVDAFENDRDSIAQDNIDAAFERAAKTAESLKRGSSTLADADLVSETGGDTTTSVQSSQKPKTKGKRDTGLKPLIFSLVEDNPKAQAVEIVDMVQAKKPKAKDGTIKVYYSQARKSLGLPNIGKRGRKSSGLYGSIKKMVQDSPDASKEAITEQAVKELDANPNTVAVYYGKAHKELGI